MASPTPTTSGSTTTPTKTMDHHNILKKDIETLVTTGRSAAFALFTLVHAVPIGNNDTSSSPIIHLSTTLLALIGLLPGLSDSLDPHPRGNPPLLSTAQVQDLSKQLTTCLEVARGIEDVVGAVTEAIWPMDGWDFLSAGDNGDVVKVGEKKKEKEKEKKEAIQKLTQMFGYAECFSCRTLEEGVLAAVGAMARAKEKDLGIRAFLSDNQYSEAPRLRKALEHEKFQIKSEGASSELPIRSAQEPAEQPPATSSSSAKAESKLQNEWVVLESETVQPESLTSSRPKKWPMSVASFNSWPPYRVGFNNQEEYDAQVKLGRDIMDRHNNGDATPTPESPSVPLDTPATTRASTPDASAENDASTRSGTQDSSKTREKQASVEDAAEEILSKGKGKEKEMASKTAQAESSSRLDAAEETLTKGKGKEKAPETTQFSSPSRPLFGFGSSKPIQSQDPAISISSWSSTAYTASYREAYMLRPLYDEFRGVIEWTYKVEQLRIDTEQVDAHVKKLGSDYSLLDSLGELHPEQLRLVQLKAKQRSGHIVCAQLGRAVDMNTTMGILQVRPVIFVVKSLWPAQVLADTEVKPKPLFPNNDPTPATNLFSGFGPKPRGDWPGDITGKSAFSWGSAPQQGGGFGQTTAKTNPFGQPATGQSSAFGGGWGAKPKDAKSYSQTLQEQGEVCSYVEDTGYPPNIAHYQTITPTMRKDISFEELRVHDVAAGRTGSMKHNGFSYPWDIDPSAGGGLAAWDRFKKGRPDMCYLFAPTQEEKEPVKKATGGLFGEGKSVSKEELDKIVRMNFTKRDSAAESSSKGEGLFANRQPGPGHFGDRFVPPTETPSSGLFGTVRPTTETPSSGLFGSQQPATETPTRNLFAAYPPATEPRMGCACGKHHVPLSTCPRPVQYTSHGIFSVPQSRSNPSSANLFDRQWPATAPPASGGLFGAPPKTGGFFAQANPATRPGGLFGNIASNNQPQIPTGGLFGRPTTTPSGQDLFESANNPSNNNTTPTKQPDPSTGNTFAAATAATHTPILPAFGQPSPLGKSANPSQNQNLTCKSCFTSLVFHPAAEQSAGICDVCAKKRDTACWLCVRQIRAMKMGNGVKIGEGKSSVQIGVESEKGKEKEKEL